jgi:hypothetical protein
LEVPDGAVDVHEVAAVTVLGELTGMEVVKGGGADGTVGGDFRIH